LKYAFTLIARKVFSGIAVWSGRKKERNLHHEHINETVRASVSRSMPSATARDGEYLWLLMKFEKGQFIITWQEAWDLSVFDSLASGKP